METKNSTEELYKAVKNDEGQYSIWPVDRTNPVSWYDTGKSGTKAECLSYIEEIWTDMRPWSFRQKMASTTARENA
jgi:MbtH protein